MSHEDLTQFVYTLSSKFDAECRFSEGIADAVTQHADNIDELYGGIRDALGRCRTSMRRSTTMYPSCRKE